MSRNEIDDATGVETTGHSWDGIKELNNPLPRWWLWTFYATVVWGIAYTIAYPAWPLVRGATEGMLGYSTRAEVAETIASFETRNADLTTALGQVEPASLVENEALNRFAVAGGAAVFRTHCSQCHGSGAAGAKGYPNLLDDDWLWGGDMDSITLSVRHGIRNDTDPDAHYSEMPAFGELLEPGEIDQLVAHLRGISGQSGEAADPAGAALFADNCAACHGEDATGDRTMGAPNLADAIWLYGGSEADIRESITKARFGVMPAWGARLTPAEVTAVSAYVHQLGGGE